MSENIEKFDTIWVEMVKLQDLIKQEEKRQRETFTMRSSAKL